MGRRNSYIIVLVALLWAGAGAAQGTDISLSSMEIYANQPVEVTADNLTIEQNSNSASFDGSARIVQGSLNLSANKIVVRYNAEQSAIDRVEVTGSIVFTNGVEIAEAQSGIYHVDTGIITLAGDVILGKGRNVVSGDALKLDLNSSRGTMNGNVKSVFLPETDQ